MDIYRNGALIAANRTGTTYVDNLGRGGGSRRYQVCNAGTSTCSNTVNVSY